MSMVAGAAAHPQYNEAFVFFFQGRLGRPKAAEKLQPGTARADTPATCLRKCRRVIPFIMVTPLCVKIGRSPRGPGAVFFSFARSWFGVKDYLSDP